MNNQALINAMIKATENSLKILVQSFIKKEGTYHNYITGANVNFENSDDVGRLNVQGLGFDTAVVVTENNI